uniref:RING-type domain-containing protein n=1 Tax=Caenorhabditis tropicalis TaxID=1561998 RepID=A0A1I7U913_9PELO
MKMEKKGKKSSNDPTDSECLFCYFEIKSNEETLECGHCRKVTHLKVCFLFSSIQISHFQCASKWLRINRSCPHCRREQLDPTEFPPLS